MNELELKYGCNPNQKPSRVFMKDGSDLPFTVLSGKPGYINLLDAFNGYQLVKELKEAIDNPSIVHLCCCNPKVWYRKTKHENKFNHICKRYQKEFYFYANKTKYYDDIYNEYMK